MTSGPSKKCPRCGQIKPLSEFHRDKHKKTGRTSYCKVCGIEKCREFREAKKRNRTYQDYRRDESLKRNYGITLKQYYSILDKQHGVCAICGSLPGHQNLHVDHNHETGEVRGLLCPMCNQALGLMRDDPRLLAKGSKYLMYSGTGLGAER